MDLGKRNLAGKLSNPAQLGGIETAVLDNGPGRGTRIAWINTGTGLRYKVVIDRALDVADAFYNASSLAWLSHAGVQRAEPFSDRGMDWLRTFAGGLLTTCGLSHIGGPESDDHGERGLHGLISNAPAEVVSVIQPDPVAGKMEMSISGVVRESRVFGPNLELRRTIGGSLGQAVISIRDEVINRGNTPAPHMLLYHINLGWPLVDEGACIVWQGKWEGREGDAAVIFKEGNDFRKCPPPQAAHSGGGEEAAFISVDPDERGQCLCGIHNPAIDLALTVRYDKKQLPWLTNWQHWGKGEYVTGLEPGTNTPTGQKKARERGELIMLAPGEGRTYELTLEILDDRARIEKAFGSQSIIV